ncbi:hypothetical protein SORBI_3001G333800 [Sorghum bicolor]|uniref:Myb-like domain-containing protein n=1 Tax=Sorghum bicolor TaxID=4558 RepID=A0A1Z5S8X9_SORBI|nr:hypothetical protein SORBI_3001G333800 [Sorghum bicolor]
MLFTHEANADQFDLLSYGNLRGVEASRNSEESNFGNDLKDGSSVFSENFSSSCLPCENYQSATIDHEKRPFSDVKPCQVACKRPKQTDHNTWLYSFEEDPLTSEVGISSPALADGLVETKQPNDIHAINGATTCSDCGPVATYNHVDDIGSPVHEYLPRKGVPIGPEHQADIPEWRPRISMIVPGTSEFCADLDCSSASTSESVTRGDDYVSESDKWIRCCVVPMMSCSSLVDWAGDNKIDCNCSDEGSTRCSRQHIIEARDSLKMSLGQDTFRELGLCEMGEDVAQRWTDDEEKLFQRVVFLNPVSLGKNFWDHLPDAFPGKTSQELVSYYFNVFMLRKRAQQNRSDVLRVDSDDDELHGEPLVEREEGDPAVESSIHEHFVSNSLPMDDDHKEFEGAQFDGSLCEKSVYNAGDCRHLPNQMPADSNTVSTAQDVYGQDNGAQCEEFHMSLPNDT